MTEQLRIGILDYSLDLAEDATLHGSGALLLCVPPSVLDLDQLGTGCDLAVDMHCQLGLITISVEALVALNVTEERGIVSAAARACGASASGGVEGWVFAVERSICKFKVEVVLYPCGYMLGW